MKTQFKRRVLAACWPAYAWGHRPMWCSGITVPSGKGDVRDEMVQMVAREVAAANVGLTIQVFPGAKPVKARSGGKPCSPTKLT